MTTASPSNKCSEQSICDDRISRNVVPQTTSHPVIRLACGAGWTPASELKSIALQACSENSHRVFSLDGLAHLDAMSLQILIAAQKRAQEANLSLSFTDISPELRHWFEIAGASELLFLGDEEDACPHT